MLIHDCMQDRAERECVGGVTPPPHLLTTANFLKFVGILTKCVDKISWPNVVGKFRVFYHEKRMQNSFNIQSCRNQTFTGDDSL